MKKFSLFLIVLFLISAGASFQKVTAQDKTKEEQEKEIKIQKDIEQQKKALTDQKKVQAEAEQNLKEQHEELDNSLNDAKDELKNAEEERSKIFMSMPRSDRWLKFREPFEFSSPDIQAYIGHSMGGDSESTTWDFSKTVKENTFSREYTFDVENSAKTVVMSVMGDCKSGEIRIKIVMPNGKNYSDILIDESGNLNWRKSFTISETENKDKTGDWKFQISSTKATGFFKISLQAF
jgi:hypothetical protein